MKKFVQSIFTLGALVLLTAVSCTKVNEFDTDQYKADKVVLQAYGPQPVVRGGQLRFVGSNLDKVVSVTIPDNNVITDIQVVAKGTHSEIRVTVPKETSAPGYPVLTLADGTTLTAKTAISYSEPISIDSVSPSEGLPGTTVTIKGDYLNLIHEVIFAEKQYVSETEFVAHDRYTIQVKVPAAAQTGKIGLGTLDEKNLEEEAALDALNIIETEEPFFVTTAKGSVTKQLYKAGETVTINGTNLDITDYVDMEGAIVTDFTATATALSFALPATATDGKVNLVMASGVEVNAGSIETVVPVVSGVTPSPVKNGAVVTLVGSDLDLVNGLDFLHAASADFAFADGKITATVPESAYAGELTLTLENGKSVTADLVLVEPKISGFSANPAAAGSDITLTGTDLDLVAAVTFAGGIKVEVEAGETEIVVAVPTAAETGNIVLNLKSGATVEVETELAVDKPAGAYIANMPGDLYSPGDMFIIDIENAEHLTGVQFDGEDVNYILGGSTLYVQIPESAGANTTITLVSDNGSVTYAMNIDPGDFIITPIWTAGFDCSGWNGCQDLAWDGYDWTSVKAGTILRFELESTKAAGEWWCISLRHGDSWGALAGVPGQYDTPENPLDVVLTQEMLDDLVNNGGLVITGDGFHLSRVCLVQDLRYGEAIWEGLFECSGWNGEQGLAWGGYDWSAVKAGQTLYFHMTPTVADEDWWCISLRHGDNWGGIPGVPGQYDTPECPLGLKLTQEMLDDLVANGGLVITGTGFNLTKVSLK